MKHSLAGGLLALALCQQCWGASAAIALETGAPAGFADLTGARQLVADLYYGGRPIGAAPVTVDLYSVRFDDPAAVLELLPGTLDSHRLLVLLGRAQPRNSHKVCRSRRQRDCGILVPENLALIYDDSRFRIDIFLAPHLVPQRAAIENPYLPESSSGISFVQNLTGTWSGVRSGRDENTESTSLFGQSILSFGESGLHSQWSASDRGDSQVYQLNWARDYRGRAWSLGLIQPRGGASSFVASPYLYGAEYRSSINSRTDNRLGQGAPLEVHMPVRGRVELHRDGRLLHSELLEAGNQLLDTSSLPGGAYEVEIKIFSEDGRPIDQHLQFFAKDSLLPPPGEWRWAFQAGTPARFRREEMLPERLDGHFVQASAARRLLDNTGVSGSIAATRDQQLVELGAHWIGRYLEVSPSFIRSSDGRDGYRLQALLKTPLFHMSLAETRLRGRGTQFRTGDADLLGRDFYQRSVSMNCALLDGRLSLRYSERDRNQFFEPSGFAGETEYTNSNRLRTMEYRRDLFRSRHWYGDLTLTHSDAGDRALTAVNFQFRYRGDHWHHSMRLKADRRGDGDGSGRLGFDTGWRDGDLWAAEIDQQFSGEVAADEFYLGSNTQLAGHRGQLNSTLNYRDRETGRSLNYLGSFNTNLMATGAGLAWGGERALDSAVMVDIDGSEDREFEILVDGARRGYAKGGGRSVINLPSFESYDIRLRPLGEGFFDYREIQETLTLYPGNVATANYEIHPQVIVLGRLVRNGRPVAHGQVSIGGQSATSDEFGVFQLEIHSDPGKLGSPPVRWEECLVPVSEREAGEHWLNLGDVEVTEATCNGEQANYAAREK